MRQTMMSWCWGMGLILVMGTGCGRIEGACVPGATQRCACLDGKPGVQSCDAQGMGWSVCGCAVSEPANAQTPANPNPNPPTSSGSNPSPGTGGNPNPSPGSSGGGEPVGGGDVIPDPGSEPRYPIIVYWGQNGFGGANPGDPSKWEKPLGQVCTENPQINTVVMGFVISFISGRNADGYPELNFANHCETPYDTRNPFLLKCPEIGEGIKTCHRLGKRVLLALGGGVGGYGFTSDAQAEQFAGTVWDMFLGGSGTVRPFGDAVADGVDLDIEGGSWIGYGKFAKKLREHMSKGNKKYLITAAPQCPFPDVYVGPGQGKALGDAPEAFDYVLVQFYNNYCSYSGGSSFDSAFAQWSTLHKDGKGPRVSVGLPSAPKAAPAGGYVETTSLPSLILKTKSNPSFGGVMLWDASFDANNLTSGKTYSQTLRTLLD